MIVSVECDRAFNGETTPRFFMIGDRRIDIAHVLDRWLGEEYDYYKIQDRGGDTFILRCDSDDRTWEIWMYKRAGVDA